jgi:hypothetical protein
LKGDRVVYDSSYELNEDLVPRKMDRDWEAKYGTTPTRKRRPRRTRFNHKIYELSAEREREREMTTATKAPRQK